MTRWVTNASPLIFLAKIQRLELLRRSAAQVLVPEAVLTEIAVYDDQAANLIRAQEWLQARPPADQGPILQMLRQELGAGEAEAIALALETQADRVVLDDLDGRKWARRLDLHPIGTLGILLAARRKGDISSVASEIQELHAAGFRASEQLIRRVLQAAGETPE